MSQSSTQAWQFSAAGQPLYLSDKELPAPGPGQILVANEAIGVNPVDWKFIDNNPINWCAGHTPGVDGAGIVRATGEGVDETLVGQTVAYHHNLAENGSFAKHTILYPERVLRVPDGLSAVVAAALPCPLLTAWLAFSKIPTLEGASVLVTGMGAVNKLLVQILKTHGFNVHVLSGSLTAKQAKTLGVTKIFRNFPTQGNYFALFDANGPDVAKALMPLLQSNGHVVSILGRIERPVDAPFTRTISYHEVALGALHTYGDRYQWDRLVIDGEALLEKIVEAQIRIEAPAVFSFNALNDALKFSKTQKQKAVVVVN
ncbi:alcohol dehydrogenase catalytic domain-containing protein [Aestuariibacter sp. A3R04]|uniref:alcohol dehydrogenase catalytic domain-containing protein n=1 Tax=Aestuariibacter sp. A3R04 TaxID=2841571 RepID=UPI001C08C7C8|nr:alcohol dehydrogenase catalytic domain-containing protein [Aestuariibacter sp. A3R04]MBU3023488.1 alcohol dehydrogenase catalytic domain-containing protein [Aestuariibacter sp. A3R04]